MGHKFYDILGISKDASKEDIKKAYKKMAIQHHPDKGGDPEKFKEVARAYEVLSNDDNKHKYDQLGDEGFEKMSDMGMSGGGFDPHSIFEQFFGGGGGFNPFFGGGDPFMRHQRHEQMRRKGRNVQHVVQISNHDAYFGVQKILKISIQKKCFKCLKSCENCQGRGMVNTMQRMGPFTTMVTQPCHICQGTGKISCNNTSCVTCKGKGDYTEEKIIELKIPMGVEMGHHIVFNGLGEQPQTENDIPGDLVFEIFVQPDPIFERNGLDLIYKSTITFQESILGKTINIPHYEEPFDISLGDYGIIQPNKSYNIQNKGMKTNQKHGNLILKFNIIYPTHVLSVELKNKLEPLLMSMH